MGSVKGSYNGKAIVDFVNQSLVGNGENIALVDSLANDGKILNIGFHELIHSKHLD